MSLPKKHERGHLGQTKLVMNRSQYATPAMPDASPGRLVDTNATSRQVGSVLKRAAYFPLFSVHSPTTRNVPLPSPTNPNRLIGMNVYEQMHRFEIEQSIACQAGGLQAVNRVGQPVANINIDWRVIPDDFVAAPDRLPPPTELDPNRSQRFAMYSGQFQWNDGQASGFHGFGAGRTFPCMVNGQPQLRLGAVVDILEGFGTLKGLHGNAVVNGFIQPPYDLALSVVVRIVDPALRLQASSPPQPLIQVPSPDPDATFLVFLGEPDPENPIVLNMAEEGHVIGAKVHELLRLVAISFDVNTSSGMRSTIVEGPIVGSLQFDLEFDSADPRVPTPFQTANAAFSFRDRDGIPIGTLRANVVEGRGFMTNLPQAPPPVVRVVGFGPFLSGTGQFSGLSGLLSLNGIISIPARIPSILYVLRISDPDKRFSQAWRSQRGSKW
jgi:hypothetical protein